MTLIKLGKVCQDYAKPGMRAFGQCAQAVFNISLTSCSVGSRSMIAAGRSSPKSAGAAFGHGSIARSTVAFTSRVIQRGSTRKKDSTRSNPLQIDPAEILSSASWAVWHMFQATNCYAEKLEPRSGKLLRKLLRTPMLLIESVILRIGAWGACGVGRPQLSGLDTRQAKSSPDLLAAVDDYGGHRKSRAEPQSR